MKLLPLLLLLVVVALLFTAGRRNRLRAAAQQQARQEGIRVGSEVVTTSGLYGTVVADAQDGTVTLSVAPGVELRWAKAALREPEWLASRLEHGAQHGVELSKRDVDEPGS